MDKALDKNAQLSVSISNLQATKEDLLELKKIIANELGDNTTNPTVTLERSTGKYDFYEVSFTILNPKSFKVDIINEWLHSLLLVGWHINATFVR